MLSWFLRVVIGGETGKREMSLFLLLLLVCATGYAMAREAEGKAMPATFGLLMLAWPTILAVVCGAFGLEFLARQGVIGKDGKGKGE